VLLQHKRIFVVEDNMENRIITRILLAKQGAILEFEAWGGTTLPKLQAFAPVDVILLDLMLGRGTSGYRIFEQIRAVEQFAKTPIIAVSAGDPAVSIPKCRTMGFNGFIAKPIDADLFPTQILKVLQGESVWYTQLGVSNNG
jgi:CheY-like chemotaxis protein